MLTEEDLGLLSDDGIHALTNGRIVKSNTGAQFVEFADPMHLPELVPQLLDVCSETPSLCVHNGSTSDAWGRVHQEALARNIFKVIAVYGATKGCRYRAFPEHPDRRLDELKRRFPEKFHVEEDGSLQRLKEAELIPRPNVPIAETDHHDLLYLMESLLRGDTEEKVLMRLPRFSSEQAARDGLARYQAEVVKKRAGGACTSPFLSHHGDIGLQQVRYRRS